MPGSGCGVPEMEAPTSLVGAFLAKKSPVDNPFSIKMIYKNAKNATKL
jgi:hypothetical protein